MAPENRNAGTMTRKERERANRRKEIIDAAQDLFLSKGFENTTMEEIAERAEFGKPTLYAYFKSKDEILFRVHMRRHQEKIQAFKDATAQHKTGYDKLRALGMAYYRYYKANPEYLRMQVYWDYKGLAFDKFGEAVRDRYEELYQSFLDLSQILRLGIEDGTLRGDLDMGCTPDLFFMTLRAVANQVLLIEPPNVSQLDDTSEDTYFHYLDIFMEGLRARAQEYPRRKEDTR
jgi:AcrR family transcriptional regulator